MSVMPSYMEHHPGVRQMSMQTFWRSGLSIKDWHVNDLTSHRKGPRGEYYRSVPFDWYIHRRGPITGKPFLFVGHTGRAEFTLYRCDASGDSSSNRQPIYEVLNKFRTLKPAIAALMMAE